MNTNFFESTENLVGASAQEPYTYFEDCIGVTGIGPDRNATSIANQKGDILLEANNENLLWLGGCIHRFRSPLGYGPLSIRRSLDLQREVADRLSVKYDTVHIDETALFLGHAFGWHAYGHLHDTLQRLFYCRQRCIDEGWKLVVNRHDRINEFSEHLSALLGTRIFPNDLIVIENQYVYSFRRLVYSHSPAILTNYSPSSLAWVNEAYQAYFRRDDSWPEGIYLSRNHVRPGSRGVTNEDQVIDFLQRKGFKVVYGNEPLADIVNLFANAKKVVGAHGSLFVNTFLCRDDCDILELCPSNRKDVTFRNKLKNANSYRQEFVEADANYNLEIDMELLNHFAGDMQ